MRVKPHTQIAIELYSVRLAAERREMGITADVAIWEFIRRHDPQLAKEAMLKAKEEGYPVPKDGTK